MVLHAVDLQLSTTAVDDINGNKIKADICQTHMLLKGDGVH